jgi:tRNA(fMet)-specific endonuclease VapC
MRRDVRALARLTSLPATEQVVICTVVRGEIMYGLHRLPLSRRRSNLEAEATFLFSAMVCVAVPEIAADYYAVAKTTAQRSGMSLDENDLWIAATALSVGAVLVTMDSDFERVEGLTVEDWCL